MNLEKWADVVYGWPLIKEVFFFSCLSTVYERRILMPQLKKLNTFWTEICVDAQDTDPFMMLLSLLQLMHQTASGYIHILHRQIFRPF